MEICRAVGEIFPALEKVHGVIPLGGKQRKLHISKKETSAYLVPFSPGTRQPSVTPRNCGFCADSAPPGPREAWRLGPRGADKVPRWTAEAQGQKKW